jgi:hypothetical protein
MIEDLSSQNYRVLKVPKPLNSKILSRVPWSLEQRITMLARSISSLALSSSQIPPLIERSSHFGIGKRLGKNKIWLCGQTGPGTKIDSAGEDQKRFNRPTSQNSF